MTSEMIEKVDRKDRDRYKDKIKRKREKEIKIDGQREIQRWKERME